MFEAANIFFPALSENTCKCVIVRRQQVQIKIPLYSILSEKTCCAAFDLFADCRKNMIKLDSDIFKLVYR